MTVFSQVLMTDQRLHIREDGQLEIVSKESRKSAGWFIRLWTRSEYNQGAIARKMKAIYKESIENQELTPTFLKNYQEVLRRAEAQNEKYADYCCISRFFKAKGEINISTHWDRLETQLWCCNNRKLNFLAPASKNLGFHHLGCDYSPTNLLNSIGGTYELIDEDHETEEVYLNILSNIGLHSVEDFINASIYSKEHFDAYLADNQAFLEDKLKYNIYVRYK